MKREKVICRSSEDCRDFLEYFTDMIWIERQLIFEKLNTYEDVIARGSDALKEVFEKYDLCECPQYDDFNWGKLNGIVTALRWMTGEDWDASVDT